MPSCLAAASIPAEPRRRIARWPILIVVLARLTITTASAATVYDLGAMIPSALNAHDVVVGDLENDSDTIDTHACMWANGTLTPLPEPAGTLLSEAYTISDTGRIGGMIYTNDAEAQVEAYFWDDGLNPTRIPPLGGTVDFSLVADLDQDGNAVGCTFTAAPHYQVGFYAPDAVSPIAVGTGDLDADKGSACAGAISGDGTTILGRVQGTDSNDGYYLWSTAAPGAPGIPIDLTPDSSGFRLLAGSVYNELLIQNDLAADGAVFGFKGSGLNRTWYLRLPNGTETPIVGLTAHNAINVHHVVAGTIATGNPNDPVHAAVWDPTTQSITDLNTLLPPDSGFLLLDALAINDAGDVAGIAVHNLMEVGFLLTTSFNATIAPDPAEPVLGTTFTLTITATNTLATPILDVTPPPTLTLTGDGMATLESGPQPTAVATLAPGASASFVYTYKATQKGAIKFSGDVHATGAQGALTATARCGLGGQTAGLAADVAAADATPTCPVDGNGTNVAVKTCTIALATVEDKDYQTNKVTNYDELTLTKLASDSAPEHGSGYPPGGT